jgi:hypothetical protein
MDFIDFCYKSTSKNKMIYYIKNQFSVGSKVKPILTFKEMEILFHSFLKSSVYQVRPSFLTPYLSSFFRI